MNPSNVYGVAVAGSASGTNVGVGGAFVAVAVAVTEGSGVDVGAEVLVENGVAVAVEGYSVNCFAVRVGNSKAVGVTVGVEVPFGKNS